VSRRRANFFGNLSRLTRAGLPVVQAGSILEQHSRNDAEARVILSLRDGLARGQTIADALGPSVTSVEYGMISAAESGGRLSEGFAQLERYYRAVAEARRRAWKAATYPLLLLHVAALCAAVPVMMNQGSALPLVAQSLGILWLALGAVLAVIYGFTKLAARNRAADALLCRLPIAGKAWKLFALARWSAVMHFQIVSSRKMSAALEAAGAASGSAGLAAASGELAAAAAAGGSVADAMPRYRFFPTMFCASFATGEASGTLDEVTAQQMEHCLDDAVSAMNAVAEWLPRVLYLVAAVYVVWRIFQIAGAISGVYQKALDGF
jgi:type II secretory pathway component PulF